MKATVLLVLGFVLFVAGVPAGGEESLFRLRSRDVGIQAFDLTVMETKRTQRTKVLNVPGFHERSAAGSRWLMCAFTDLAIRRGFDYWAVVYPEPPGEELLVGFPESESERVSQTLGPEFVEGRMLPPTSVDFFATHFCGMRRGPTH